MRRAERPRRGAALVETVIAIVLLAFAGVGMVALLGQTMGTVHQMRHREGEIADAGGAMDRMAAWTRADLEARAGETRWGAWKLQVSEPAEHLFDVSLRDTLTGAELLRTALYRPDTTAADAQH